MYPLYKFFISSNVSARISVHIRLRFLLLLVSYAKKHGDETSPFGSLKSKDEFLEEEKSVRAVLFSVL